MVQRRQRERSLFEVLLPDGHKLWPDWLRKIDTLLEDEAVIEVVAQSLETRWPQSRRRGRPGTPAEVVIRMLILKYLFDWSYNDSEREVRANLVYRMFTRIDAGDVPDAKTILKIARTLGPEVIEQLHRQIVDVAKRAGVTHGRRWFSCCQYFVGWIRHTRARDAIMMCHVATVIGWSDYAHLSKRKTVAAPNLWRSGDDNVNDSSGAVSTRADAQFETFNERLRRAETWNQIRGPGWRGTSIFCPGTRTIGRMYGTLS